MSDFRAAFGKIKKSVVGIGIRNDPEYQIIGTGFVIDEKGLIATNRHVLEGIADFTSDGIKVKQGAAVFLFFEVPHGPDFRAVTGFATADIAFVAAPPDGAINARDLDQQIGLGLAIPSARFPEVWLETNTEKKKKKQKLRHRT